MSLSRALPVVSIAFCILYVICMYFNFPVFTYVPKDGTFHAWLYTPPSNLAPGMYWYGWLLTSAVGAIVIGGLTSLAPPPTLARLPTSAVWIVPLALILFLLYVLREWFTH
jgi:hypothetical protein